MFSLQLFYFKCCSSDSLFSSPILSLSFSPLPPLSFCNVKMCLSKLVKSLTRCLQSYLSIINIPVRIKHTIPPTCMKILKLCTHTLLPPQKTLNFVFANCHPVLELVCLSSEYISHTHHAQGDFLYV